MLQLYPVLSCYNLGFDTVLVYADLGLLALNLFYAAVTAGV